MNQSKNEKVEFLKLMKAFEINCSVAEITKDQLKLYFEAFKPYSLNVVKEAFSKVLYTWKYNKMPTVGVFMDEISTGPTIEAQAELQATDVLKQVNEIGTYGQPKFNDSTTIWLMQNRFNFKSLCLTIRQSDEKWFIKEFVQAYLYVKDSDQSLLSGAPKEIKQIAVNLFKGME
ncbi:MAG: hypothetical protein BBJ57_07335 [Desulfobacterales bacterium PC51MH44]|nr:MAG: hypothetical protein BBJ57_07335 [Desulfobacterales bacterium PC51MH44]